MLGSTLEKNEEQRENLQEGIATKTQELGELRSSMTAQQTKAEEETKRKLRIKIEIQEITSQLVTEEENTQQARGRLEKALDSMAEDVGSREELENLRQKAQKAVGNYKGKANKDKDLSHELALKNQSMRAQLQSTRESMDRMASQVQRSKERIESLTSQIEESDEPLEKMRSDLETLLQQRLEVEKELGVAKSKVMRTNTRSET
jgi:chromosome segregation protein